MKPILIASVLLLSFQAFSMSVDWSGVYRAEMVEVDKTNLSSEPSKGRKSYFLNHLHLSPKIIAADGINVVARFDVLSNAQYPDSYVGQTFGLGNRRTNSKPGTSTEDSNVAGSHQKSSYLSVSQLYLSINQEYGAIVVGRAPKQFGLGITHNAGNGLWDHWYDTEDMLAYKFMIGNLSIMPILGKVYDENVAQGGEVNDMIWNIEYNNPETESVFAIYHQTRTSNGETNDAPATALSPSGTLQTGWSMQTVNVLLSRGWESFKFRLEAGFQNGGTGVYSAAPNSEEVKINAYGVALEMDFPRPESKWFWQIRTGIVSGDDPNTINYEGFHFDRNYDLAFLMFNHPMGQYDVFKTNLQRNINSTTGTPYANDNSVDEETVSNVFYLAPRFKYAMNDKWDWTGNFAWAQLQQAFAPETATTFQSTDKSVGFEVDMGFTYKPVERLQWVNEVGFFFPGAAFKGGTNAYSADMNFGFQSKAAISF